MNETERRNYENLNQAIAKTENIGVIGSPSSTTEIKLDILKTAVEKGLIGAFSFFTFQQDGKKHCTLGQITEINLRNPWVEDATMRGLIRQKGRVDPITGRQDTHNANMTVGAVFEETANGFNQGLQGSVPETGTLINLVDDSILNMLLKQYKDDMFYLGKVYGSNPLMPMWFRHFGKEKGGLGEAYHIGVFGKTGSGKSKLSEMILLAYSRHPNMSIFIIDPQGEFTRAFKNEKSPLRKTFTEKLKKEVKTYDVQDLILTVKGKSWERFKKILVAKPGFLDEIGVRHNENKENAAAVIVEILNGKYRESDVTSKKEQTKLFPTDLCKETKSISLKKIAPSEAYKKESFEILWECLKREDVQSMIYTSETTLARVKSRVNHGDLNDRYDTWRRTANLFSFKENRKGIEIEELVRQVTENDKGSIIVINLSEGEGTEELLWNENTQAIIIKELLDEIIKQSEYKFKNNKSLNTLIIIDEAHRIASRDIKSDDEFLYEVRDTLKDAVRTTRKYGLGWMFISQTLSSLDKEILNQLRIYLFGFGLGWGTELQSLKDIISGNTEAIKLYQSFRDPQSSIGQKQYPFMGIGPISPLSFSGAPLFFTALDCENYDSDFFEINKL